MIILCMARNVYSADSLGSYEVFGGGLDTCKVYLRLRSGSPEGLRYTMWTAGYLTAANRYIPGIYNIAGQVGLVHIFELITDYCTKHESVLYTYAVATVLDTYYMAPSSR